MKLQLDTKEKTIKVEETVNLNELLTTLKKLLPNGEWKKFKLQTNTVINWSSSPIIIRDNTPNWYQYPYTISGTINCGDTLTLTNSNCDTVTSNNCTLNKGVYNIEIK